MSDENLDIRLLKTTSEFEQAVNLQKVYWGDDMSDIIPTHMLISIANYGGHILGAYVESALVGILVGFIGADFKKTPNASQSMLIMSKRMVVLPQYRGRKIGEKLKLAQAEFARQHDIKLVTWTFDPVLSRNAYLNIHKLRAVIQTYKDDYFGKDAVNPTMRADRIVANLWVNHPRLNIETLPDARNAQIINQTNHDAMMKPLAIHQPSEEIHRFEIPPEFVPIDRIDPSLGKQWRNHIREGFHTMLDNGYVATDFVRVDDRSFYVFTKDDASFQF